MNLVFFDIECASVYKYTAKICAFGYVVCDENFNMIAKEDILINPHGKFHLTDGRGERGLVLPYKYSDFKNYPSFVSVYPKIRKLLEDENNLVFGHATYNDVNYLNLETKRFHLPPFKFSYSDSQLMYMTSIGDFSRQFGLEYITQNLNVEFTPHRAADDAYATMRVVEALSKKHGCSGTRIDETLGIKRGVIKNGRIYLPDSVAFSEYRKKCTEDKIARSVRRQKFFAAASRGYKRRDNSLKGMVFSFSRELEDKIDISIPYVEKICARGGVYTSGIEKCNVYVCFDNDTTVRTKNAKATAGIKIMSDSELVDMLSQGAKGNDCSS